MALPSSSFADVARALETATAQLRVLSALPEAQRDGDLKETINELKLSVASVETKMKELKREVQSVRDRSDARLKRLEFA